MGKKTFRASNKTEATNTEATNTEATKTERLGASTVTMVSMLTMVVAFVVWSMISPVAPQLQQQFGLSEFQKSMLVATPVLLGSLFRVPIGMLTDRFGGRKTYTALMLFLLIPLFGITTAHSFPVFLLWEVLLGISGTSFAVGIGHVSAWYPPSKQGLILGITAIGNIGTAVAGFTIPGLYLNLGFRGTAFLLMVPVALSALALWFFTRDAKRPTLAAQNLARKDDAGASQASGTGTNNPGDTPANVVSPAATHDTRFWSNPQVWLLAFYYFITFGGFVAFGNYLPTLLQGQLHLQSVDAGFRSAGFVVLATLMRPIGGHLADRFNPAKLLFSVFLITGVCSLAWAFGVTSMNVTTAAALVIAVMLGIGNGSVFKLVPLYFPANTGKATGIVGAIGGVGGFFPPLIMGAFKQNTGSYLGGFILLFLTTMIALFLIVYTNRNRSKNEHIQPSSSTRGLQGV